MGIRFRCNNCERRLNVKAHQAGLAGLCPHCGGDIVIPKQSTIESKSRQSKSSDGKSAQPADAFTLQPNAGTSQLEADSDDSFALNSINADSLGSHEPDVFMLGKPRNKAIGEGAPDPIDEKSKQVWYVRHPRKSEVGPVRGKKMRELLRSGHIIAECVVWREDWEDWEKAYDVFPHLKQPTEAKDDRVFRDPSMKIEKTPAQMLADRKQRRKRIALTVAILVGVATIVGLTLVLVKLISI